MDAALREAERAARARPEDAAAQRAWAAALDRAGERRGALLALDAAAALGDDGARAELVARSDASPRRRVGPRGAARARVVTLPAEARAVEWVAATEGAAALRWSRRAEYAGGGPRINGPTTVVALDPATLDARFTRDEPRPVGLALLDRDLLRGVARRDGPPELELLDGGTGRTVLAAPLQAHPAQLLVHGLLLLIGGGSLGARPCAVDAAPAEGRFGAERWRAPVQSHGPIDVVRGELVCSGPIEFQRFDLTTGRYATALFPSVVGPAVLWDHQGDDLLVRGAQRAGIEGATHLELRTRLDAPARWTQDVPGAAWLAGDRVTVVRTDVRPPRLVALDRRTGAVVKQTELPGLGPRLASRDALFIVTVEADRARVTARDLASHEEVLALDVECGRPLAGPADLTVAAGGLLVALPARDGSVVLVRIDAGAAPEAGGDF